MFLLKNQNPIRPICCGESLEVRDAGDTLEFVCTQVRAAFAGIDAAQLEARELVCYAADKSREQLYRDMSLYASVELEKRVEEAFPAAAACRNLRVGEGQTVESLLREQISRSRDTVLRAVQAHFPQGRLRKHLKQINLLSLQQIFLQKKEQRKKQLFPRQARK